MSGVRQYRKRMISEIPTLNYLDDRPVFPLERACAEAWAEGGLDAEKAARKKYNDDIDAKDKRNHEFLNGLREEGRAKRAALAAEGRTAMLDVGMDSDGEWEPEPEPPELIAARAKLAMFEAGAYTRSPSSST
jgi:dynein assembly factor 1